MNQLRKINKILVAILTLSLIFLGGCDNFMTSTEDFKTKLKEEVAVANAESVNFTVTSTPSAGGSLSVLGSASKKVGESFSLTANVNDAYVFSGWTSTGSGNVSFTNASSATTTAQITIQASNVVITANFTKRPTIIDYGPAGTNVLRNQLIYVQFSRAMDPTSFAADTISVTTKTSGVPGATASSIFGDFILATTADGFTLTPRVPMGNNQRITVSVTKNIRDLSGTTMSEDFSWYFTTGLTTDTSRPTFGSAPTVDKGHVTTSPATQLSDGAYATNTRNITINLSNCASNGAVILNAIGIVETDTTTLDETTISWSGFALERSYTLATSGDGPKTLTLTLQNSNGLESVATQTVSLYLDTVNPTISSLVLATNNGSGTQAKVGDLITLNISASDVGSGLPSSAAATIAAQATNATGTNVSGSYQRSTMVTGSTAESNASYTATVTDIAGNIATCSTGATGSVLVDRTVPTVTVIKLLSDNGVNTAYAKTGDHVTMYFTVTDIHNYDTPTATILGISTVVSVTYQNYTALYTVGPGDAEGLIDSYTASANDRAGNSGLSISVASPNVTIDKTPPSITISAPSPLAAANGTNVVYTITYTGAYSVTLANAGVSITGTASGTFAVAGTGNTTRTVTITNLTGNGPLGITLAAGSATDAIGNTTLAASSTISLSVDNTAPVISSVTFDPTSGWKITGQTITMQINAGEVGLLEDSITVNTKTISGFTDNLNNSYNVTYTVVNGDPFCADTSQLPLSVVLRDAVGNSSAVFTTSPAATSCPAIKTTLPTISGITLNPSSGMVKIGDSITMTIFASETGLTQNIVKLNDVTVTGFTSAVGNTYTATYTVVANNNDISDLSTIPVSIVLSDVAGNDTATYTTSVLVGSSPGIDAHVPTVSSVTSSTPNGSYKVGDVISIQVAFSEVVTVTGTPRIELSLGGSGDYATYSSGSPGTTLTFNYTVDTGDTSSDLDYVAATSLELNGGTINDVASNNATLNLAAPGATNSLGANKALVIDTTAPTFTATVPTYANSGNLVIEMNSDASGFSAIQHLAKTTTTTEPTDWTNVISITSLGSSHPTLTAAINITLAAGELFWYRVVDGVGNISTSKSVAYGTPMVFTSRISTPTTIRTTARSVVTSVSPVALSFSNASPSPQVSWIASPATARVVTEKPVVGDLQQFKTDGERSVSAPVSVPSVETSLSLSPAALHAQSLARAQSSMQLAEDKVKAADTESKQLPAKQNGIASTAETPSAAVQITAPVTAVPVFPDLPKAPSKPGAIPENPRQPICMPGRVKEEDRT